MTKVALIYIAFSFYLDCHLGIMGRIGSDDYVDALEDEGVSEYGDEGEGASSLTESQSVSTNISNKEEDLDDIGVDYFYPPLYRQRYDAVSSILRLQGSNKRIVDFEDVQEIVGVDMDDYALEGARYRTAPLFYEHLHPRKKPLDIYLMNGDIGDFDERLKNVDAVSAIEVVEHLSQVTLDNFKEMLFGQMKPRIIVITTPNAEYNVLFSNMSGFRHPDHVFEWNRSEFRTWCHRITDEYPMYSVSLSGVGFSVDNPQVGPCSQIATFSRNEDTSTEEVYIRDVQESALDDRSFEEKLNNQLEYYINDCFLSIVVQLDGEYHVIVPPINEECISSEIEEEDNNLYNSYVSIDLVEEELWD
ncbi:HENMT1 [Lepeophtheirus salmonis]|uniref:Small RNA 2'-O-methyltransferase n=1 Tax=Lepeophtheirus salmonis TaxID=72036 RepID=A0A7R8D3V4_LEPSM|nr:HENMT1 [Lepeophtheirus salmonis]CAF3020520.1 HENMT1 [Lepeophtheirus salmonis]